MLPAKEGEGRYGILGSGQAVQLSLVGSICMCSQ
jgi:hypothetical protein